MSSKDDATENERDEVDQPDEDEATEEDDDAGNDPTGEESGEVAEASDEGGKAEVAGEPSAATDTRDGGILAWKMTWLTTRPLWLVGLGALIAAAIATEIVGGLARALDVPMEAPTGIGGDGDPEKIGPSAYTFGVFSYGVPGVLVAMLLAWKVSKPAKIWAGLAIVFTVVSLAFPYTADNTTTATQTVLSFTHIVAGAIIIPQVFIRLTALEREKATASAGEPVPTTA